LKFDMLLARISLYKNRFKLVQLKLLICLFTLFPMAKTAYGQTVVDVTTSIGNFSIELFDSAAPATVANFLSYVTSGRYNGAFIHRSVPGFVIQGGLFSINQTTGVLAPIQLDPPVVNEYNQPNSRGTLAMAKVGGDPNSANSQWFVNLADNGSALDERNNGGFTVFGRVLGDGMTIFDTIATLPRVNLQLPFLGSPLADFPLQNYTGGQVLVENLVSFEMSVAVPEFKNSYNPETGVLTLRVRLSDTSLIQLQFNQVASSTNIVFSVALESVTALTESDISFAQFDLATGELLIPELAINGEVAGRNVRLNLTDPQQLLFTLVSVDP
jgi:peptidyl-prolyl cis-trans isomerase A (cyclophilin A)